jgi:tetratricopeptide (TPR) repeat protein
MTEPSAPTDVGQLIRELRYSDAMTRLDEAQQDQNGGEGHLALVRRARCLLGLERSGEAANIVRHLFEQDDRAARPAALLLKAKYYRQCTRWVDDGLCAALDAISVVERERLQAEPLIVDAHLEAALLFARKRCIQLAEREIEKALAVAPDHELALAARADIRLDLDDRDGAEETLARLLKLDTVEARRLGSLSMARLRFATGSFAAAHEHLAALEPLPEGWLAPRRLRAQLLAAEHRWQEAATAYDEVARIGDARRATDALEAAGCCFRAGEWDKAVDSYTAVAENADEGSYAQRSAARLAHLLTQPRDGNASAKRLKEFPTVEQLRNHCGPASCALYMRYFGKDASQTGIAALIKENNSGTSVHKMRGYLVANGFTTRRIEADLAQLKRLIDQGIPVIIEESYSSSSHVAVAIGYDDVREILEVQDPMSHGVRETPYEDLDKLRALANHGALVGVPNGEEQLLDAAGAVECEYIALVDQAWAALDEDRGADGDKLVDQAVALHPAYELAWMYRFRRAREAAEAGDDGARTRMHQILGEINALWPDDEWPQQFSGQALFAEGRTREARVAFERAKERDDPDPYNWWMIARCEHRMGDADAAYEALREALARQPGYVPACSYLGDLAYERGEQQLAWLSNDAAREQEPEHAFNHGVHGQLLARDGRRKEALAAFKHALKLDADLDWVASEMAKLQARRGQLSDAKKTFERLIKRRPDNVGNQIDLADMLYRNGKLDACLKICKRLVANHPKSAGGRAIMGAALARSGQAAAASRSSRRALRLQPLYPWVYAQRGRFLLDQGKPRAAIDAFSTALGMARNATNERGLGDALLAAGYADDGLSYLRSAAISARADEAELRRVGKLFSSTGTHGVDGFFRQVASDRPNDLAVMRAHVHSLVEQMWAPSTAQPVLARIAELAPEDPLAQCYVGGNMMDASVEAEKVGERLLKKAVKRYKGGLFARRWLARHYDQRGGNAQVLKLLDHGQHTYSDATARITAFLMRGDHGAAKRQVRAFRKANPDDALGVLRLEYQIATARGRDQRALELAEEMSREMHERDDDGRLDTWEQRRFTCMVRLGEYDRAQRFAEAQATAGGSLGELAFNALREGALPLAVTLARRSLHLDDAEAYAVAVLAHECEMADDFEGCLTQWQRASELDPHWHTCPEQMARVLLGSERFDDAAALAEQAVAGGHLCLWALGIRAQSRVLSGDLEGARRDADRAYNLAGVRARDSRNHDMWGLRFALRGKHRKAARAFERYLATDPLVTPVDRRRVERLRGALKRDDQ